MPMSQQTRKGGGKGKVKRKHKWRRGDGKQLAEQLARDQQDRARERRQLGRAADDEDAQLFVIDTDAVGAGGMASSKKLAKRNKALKSEAILLPNANIPAIGSRATEHSKMVQNPKKRKRTQEQLSKETQKVLGKTRAKARNATPGAGHLRKQKPKLEQYDLWGEELPDPEQRDMQPTRKQGELLPLPLHGLHSRKLSAPLTNQQLLRSDVRERRRGLWATAENSRQAKCWQAWDRQACCRDVGGCSRGC
jgi:hypothetical protein